MNDYPDWTRLFYLTGTAITIPINIESSDITLEVNIASAVTLDVDITAASVGQLDINLAAAAITLNVNLAAQSANIDISFADQAVAVFDAAKWFAHTAAQWTISASGVAAANASLTAIRVVPVGKTAYVAGLAGGYYDGGVGTTIFFVLYVAGGAVMFVGANTGGGLIFDVPFRGTAGQNIIAQVTNYSAGNRSVAVCCWGWDE